MPFYQALTSLFYYQQHYQNDADGLCTKLIRALPKKGDSFGAVRIQDFEAGGWVIQKKDLQEIELIGRGEFGGDKNWEADQLPIDIQV